MSKKRFQKQIEKQLEKLQELLNKITEAQIINPDEPETWDSDTLYNLIEKCKEVLKLLEDQPLKGKYNEFGQPLYEDGLCSLVDSYQEQKENHE